MVLARPEPIAAPSVWRGAPADPMSDRLTALVRVGTALARPLDVDGLFRAVYRELSRVLDTSIFILGLHDEANHMVHVVRQVYAGTETAGVSFPLGGGFTSQAIRTRQPQLIRHWSAEGPAIRVRYASGEGKTPESGLTVPLLWGEHVLGVLLVQSYEPSAYNQADLQLIQAVGSHLATALARLRGSERLDAQLQRRVSELETILASMTDGLLILDPTGCVVRLNQAARALLSVGDTSTVLGKPLDGAQWDQWPPGPRAIAEALAPAAVA